MPRTAAPLATRRRTWRRRCAAIRLDDRAGCETRLPAAARTAGTARRRDPEPRQGPSPLCARHGGEKTNDILLQCFRLLWLSGKPSLPPTLCLLCGPFFFKALKATPLAIPTKLRYAALPGFSPTHLTQAVVSQIQLVQLYSLIVTFSIHTYASTV